MARLLMLLFGIGLILTILALISCLSAEAGQVRALPRSVWVIVILVIPVVGAIMYLSAGRPLPEYDLGAGVHGGGAGTSGRMWRAAAGLSTREQRVVAPDDDPDFLRGIDTNRRAKDDEMLRRWEEDFRKRDDEPPNRDKSIGDSPPSDG